MSPENYRQSNYLLLMAAEFLTWIRFAITFQG